MSSYKNGELLAIEYDVWISGKKLNLAKKQCINSIEIVETVDGSDTCTIKISDPEFLYIEDNIFIEENKIKVQLGWVGVTYRVKFEGYISAIDIIFFFFFPFFGCAHGMEKFQGQGLNLSHSSDNTRSSNC